MNKNQFKFKYSEQEINNALDIKSYFESRMQKDSSFGVDFSFNTALSVTKLIESKISSRFWERWIAFQIGARCKNKDKDTGEDGGDLVLPGERSLIDCIELKTCEKTQHVGGGQFRFWEKTPWYLFFTIFRGPDARSDYFELFLLTKQELINEVVIHGNKVGSSQGSGKFNSSREQMLQILNENLIGLRQDLLSFGFNPKSETNLKYKKNDEVKSGGGYYADNISTGKEIYKRWKKHYNVTINTLQKITSASENHSTLEEMKKIRDCELNINEI